MRRLNRSTASVPRTPKFQANFHKQRLSTVRRIRVARRGSITSRGSSCLAIHSCQESSRELVSFAMFHPRANLHDGPRCMFTDERLAVPRCRFQRRQRALITDISQCDANVAQQATAFCPEDWSSREHRFESRVIERKQLKQIGLVQFSPCVRLHHGSLLREAVPRTDREAIITTVNAVTDEWSQRDRDRTFQFDGEIRNASARIKIERC